MFVNNSPKLGLLALVTLVSACSGSPSGLDNEPKDTPVDPPSEKVTFELEEATVASIHAAFAGETLLEDGSTLTCEGLVQMYVDRIVAYNDFPQPNGGLPIRGVLNISTTALEQARELDALYELDGGVGERYLHCMPVLLKDNYDTYDQPSTQGSYSMINHQAAVDADSVAGLREAGALILGKANQDEFAFFTTGFSARAIQVMNPYNTQESPAGSSSGTGASIGANFAIGGTGSDTCQSIRHPSSVNGLVGIRPSIGVISAHGIFPLNHARDTGGPMTRTVRDAALMLTAMAREDARDYRTHDFPESERPESYAEFLDREIYGLAGKNLGVIRDLGGNTDALGAGQQAELIDAAVAQMEALGANVYDVYLPDYQSLSIGSAHYDMNEYFGQFDREGGSSPRACVSNVSATDTHDRAANCQANTPVSRGGILETLRVGPRTAALFASVASGDPDRAPTAAEFQSLVDMRAYVTAQMDELKDSNGEVVLDEELNPIRLDALLLSPGPTGGRTCDFGSTTQMGSIVVPVGFDSSVAGIADSEGRGVPRGLEIFVRQFDEGTGIGIAYDYEQATLHRAAPFIEPDSTFSGSGDIQRFNALQAAAIEAFATIEP